MVVRQFLEWMQKANAVQRAEATRELANSYICEELTPQDHLEVEATLVSLLDDSSPLVRKALAETLAHAKNAPPSVIAMLAQDQSEIAEIVVKHSPVFYDSELVELARIASPPIQYALATREDVSPALALSLANFGSQDVVDALFTLEGLDEHEAVTTTLVKRFGEKAQMREKLNDNFQLSATNKHALIQNLSSDLAALMQQTGWLSQDRTNLVLAISSNRAILQMTLGLEREALTAFISTLLSRNEITSNLLARALFCGQKEFFELSLSKISGLELPRIQALMRDNSMRGVTALLEKCNIPLSMIPLFEAILEPNRGALALFPTLARADINKSMVDATLRIYLSQSHKSADSTLMLLRRFAAEAAREDARQFTTELLVEAKIEQTHTLDGASIGWDVEEQDYSNIKVEGNETTLIAADTPLSAVDLFKLELENAPKLAEPTEPTAYIEEEATFNPLTKPHNDDRLTEKELEELVLDIIINGHRRAA